MKILVVEDDDRVAEPLVAFLGRTGYATERVATGAAAIDALGPDVEVVLLDLGLPDIDGIDVCRRIRGISAVPIIIATARSQVEERIKGLHAGADDFVVKPYDVRELIARIEAVTRRSRAAAEPTADTAIVTIGGVNIDLVHRVVSVDQTPIELTPKEFEVLTVLVRYPGVAVPRDRIIRAVWGTDWNGFNRSLEVHVASIRRKIGRDALIATVRGVGYRFTGE